MAFRRCVALQQQARIFLPNWYIKMVRPGKELSDDEVMFHVPLQMTKLDVKNYLESIYGIKVAKVNTRIQLGKTKRVPGKPGKEYKKSDVKIAYVSLAEGTFKFPNLFSDEETKGSTETNSTMT